MEPNYKEAYETLREELNQCRIHYNQLFDVSVNNANFMLQNQELQTTVDDLRLKLHDTQHELSTELKETRDKLSTTQCLHDGLVDEVVRLNKELKRLNEESSALTETVLELRAENGILNTKPQSSPWQENLQLRIQYEHLQQERDRLLEALRTSQKRVNSLDLKLFNIKRLVKED